LRRHLDLAFIAEGLNDGALFGVGGTAKNAHRRGFFYTVGGAEVDAAALQFCVVTPLALFGEKRPRVFLEELQLRRSLCPSGAETQRE